MLSVELNGRSLMEPFLWVGPRLIAPLQAELGALMTWAELPLGEGGLAELSAGPSSALLWATEGAEGGERRGRLTWSSAPQRGVTLGWSERVLTLSEGARLTLTPAS